MKCPTNKLPIDEDAKSIHITHKNKKLIASKQSCSRRSNDFPYLHNNEGIAPCYQTG
jgi:hypothetical protein